jgi:hypothetical protein
MNLDLLQNLYTGLETLMRTRRELLAGRALTVETKPSDAGLPLSPGGRENPSPDGKPPLGWPTLETEACSPRIAGAGAWLSHLPKGEGQGEGKAAVQEFHQVRRPECLPS